MLMQWKVKIIIYTSIESDIALSLLLNIFVHISLIFNFCVPINSYLMPVCFYAIIMRKPNFAVILKSFLYLYKLNFLMKQKQKYKKENI